MKDILVYVPAWGLGTYPEGISTYIMNIYKHMDRDKIRFTIISWGSVKSFYHDKFLSLGGKIISSSRQLDKKGIQRKIIILKELVSIINDNHFDGIYINTSVPYDHIFMHIIKKKCDVNIRVIHSHNSGWGNSKFNVIRSLFSDFAKRFEKDSNVRFACGDKAARFLFSKKSIQNGEVTIVKNGIDTLKFKFYNEKRVELKKKLNLDNSIVIGHVGAFNYQKNHRFIIDIFKAFRLKNKKSKLVLIGEGRFKQDICDYVCQQDLQNEVIFVGTTDRVFEYLQIMDCFIMPSLYEGLPIVGIEAQAAGLPMVVSDTVSEELNISGKVEFLSLSSPVEQWVNKIEQCLKYPRSDDQHCIFDAGYDSKVTAQKVQEILLSTC